MSRFRSFSVALQLLTILPAPSLRSFSAKDEEKAIYWYPVVGLIVGGITSGVFALSAFFTHDMRISVLVALFTSVYITGAMHIDGLADSADALFSSKADRHTKLLIMKDSRIGTMGSLALIFYMLLKLELLSALPFEFIWKSFLLESVLGKFFIFLMMRWLPYVSINSKLLTRFRNVIPNWWYGISLGVIFTLPFIFYPFRIAIAIVGISSLTIIVFARWIKKSLGGATGDIYGTTQELVGFCIPAACYLAIKSSLF